MPHVFLSYSSSDQQLANQLETVIRDAHADVWRDIHRIEGGQAFWERIEAAIGKARGLLLLLSQNSFNSEAIKHEVEYALEHKVPIIPLLKGFRANNLPEWWQVRLGHLHMLTVFPLTQARRDSVARAVEAFLGKACRTVALFNMKGGVGKTTLAAQLAARLNAAKSNGALSDPRRARNAAAPAFYCLRDVRAVEYWS
jgi:hypothetical protein